MVTRISRSRAYLGSRTGSWVRPTLSRSCSRELMALSRSPCSSEPDAWSSPTSSASTAARVLNLPWPFQSATVCATLPKAASGAREGARTRFDGKLRFSARRVPSLPDLPMSLKLGRHEVHLVLVDCHRPKRRPVKVAQHRALFLRNSLKTDAVSVERRMRNGGLSASPVLKGGGHLRRESGLFYLATFELEG